MTVRMLRRSAEGIRVARTIQRTVEPLPCGDCGGRSLEGEGFCMACLNERDACQFDRIAAQVRLLETDIRILRERCALLERRWAGGTAL